jgi:transposase
VTAQSIANGVGQAAIDDGKPLPGKEGLSTAEREELVRLRRQMRQVQMERDILAKAAAWFGGRSDATPTKSSDS